MDIPGAAGIRDPEAWTRAQEQQQRLLEDLKREVKAELRDIGVLRKELRITVPAKVIADHLEHNYAELMHDAFVPGFRKGRAPRRLIEKRYGHEVRESLTSSMVGQSYFAAVENEKLEVLGEPRFRIETGAGVQLLEIDEALTHVTLPESGDFSYVCEIELKPTFELPELTGIEIRAPDVRITPEMVADEMLRHRKLRGRFVPVADGAARDDQVIADLLLTAGGAQVKREENVALPVRPSALDNIPLRTLDKVLAGARPGDVRRVACSFPEDFERADLRGQAGEFAFTVHEVKRLEPQPLADFLREWGFDGEDEARTYFHAALEAERGRLVREAQRSQIERYLLEHTKLELPEEYSARQTSRAVLHRVIELQRRGLPAADIEAQIDALRTSAREEVAAELRLAFVLDKVAEQLGVTVLDEEVNTEIARMARLYGRRFDRVRDELQARGLLDQLVATIRHSKCVDELLKTARVVSVPAEGPAAQPPAEVPAAEPVAAEAAAQPPAEEPAAEPPAGQAPRARKRPRKAPPATGERAAAEAPAAEGPAGPGEPPAAEAPPGPAGAGPAAPKPARRKSRKKSE